MTAKKFGQELYPGAYCSYCNKTQCFDLFAPWPDRQALRYLGGSRKSEKEAWENVRRNAMLKMIEVLER